MGLFSIFATLAAIEWANSPTRRSRRRAAQACALADRHPEFHKLPKQLPDEPHIGQAELEQHDPEVCSYDEIRTWLLSYNHFAAPNSYALYLIRKYKEKAFHYKIYRYASDLCRIQHKKAIASHR